MTHRGPFQPLTFCDSVRPRPLWIDEHILYSKKSDLHKIKEHSRYDSIYSGHSPVASLEHIIWLSNLWQSGPERPKKKAVGSSVQSRVTHTQPRPASRFRVFALLSTRALLLLQGKSKSDTQANYLISTRYKVPTKLVNLSGFTLFVCGKQHNLTCPHLQVQRTQLSHIILPSSEIKSINSASAQWLIKRC